MVVKEEKKEVKSCRVKSEKKTAVKEKGVAR